MYRPLSLSLGLLLLPGCARKEEGVRPVVGPITEAVYASGTVEAADQYDVYSSASGILVDVFVKEGDSVRSGQPLMLIDDRNASIARKNAELALELSRTNAAENSPLLKERKAAVELAREKLINDSSLFARQKALWDQRIGSRAEYDQRELAYRSARTSFQNARSALEDARTRVRSELEMARNEHARSQLGQGDLTVRSLVDGRVFDLLLEKGELVTPQRPLAVVGRANAFVVELRVDEQDIARVRLGQQVLISMDSHPDRTFKAVITHIRPILDQRSRTFTVEAGFTDPPPQLYPYLTVEANIIVSHKDRALTIPSDHLVDGRYVLTPDGERHEVQAGLQDLQRTEIIGGIDSTTTLLKP